MKTKLAVILVTLALAGISGVFSSRALFAAMMDVSNPQWSVHYLIDQSQTVFGASQFDSPRDVRGLALAPDGRYLYAGYNNPSSDPDHIKQVRKIDTTQSDYTKES